MRTIFDQLTEAFESSGLTVSQLLEKSGLELERSTLQRKLSGGTPLRLPEAEALAKALGVTIMWPEPTGESAA